MNELIVKQNHRCPDCDGTGVEPCRPDDPEYECARCDGTGYVSALTRLACSPTETSRDD